MSKWECYIEEFNTENGINARIRDKKTNKKVSLQIKSLKEKNEFLRFLSSAKENKEVMPTVFDRNGYDVVIVLGVKQKETVDCIFVDAYENGGGYMFGKENSITN